MPDLKLARIPDRTPVKLALTLAPDLAAALTTYADLYRQAYDQDAPLAELVPAMLSAFLDSDREFKRAHRTSRK